MGSHMSTPQALFNFANERWGPFDLDAAASDWNHKCKYWFGTLFGLGCAGIAYAIFGGLF